MTSAERRRAAEMADRYRHQIDNQVRTINRLLEDGTYDGEMAKLHEELAEARRLLEVIAAAESAYRNGSHLEMSDDEALSVFLSVVRGALHARS